MPKDKSKKIRMKKGNGKGRRILSVQRKGPRKTTVLATIEFSPGNTLNVEFNYEMTDEELLDAITEDFEIAAAEINDDGVVTSEEALQFYIQGFSRISAEAAEMQSQVEIEE